MEWIEQNTDDVCLLPKPKNTIFPEDRSNRDMHHLCNKLKGHMTVTDSQAKQDLLTEEFKRKMPHLYGRQCKLMFALTTMTNETGLEVIERLRFLTSLLPVPGRRKEADTGLP